MAQNDLIQHVEDYAVMAGYWGEGIGRGTLLTLPFSVLAASALALIFLVMGSILVRSVT